MVRSSASHPPSALRHHGLFTRDYVRAQAASPGETQTISLLREWWGAADISSLEAAADTLVSRFLITLGFASPIQSRSPGSITLRLLQAGQPVGICLITEPGADMSATYRGGYPAASLIESLRAQGLTWGILTNGRLWRMLSTSGPRPYDDCLEIDLGIAFANSDTSALAVFVHFYSAAAFAPDGSSIALDHYRAGAQAGLKQTERYLKRAVEEMRYGRHAQSGQGVLQRLCLGFDATLGPGQRSEATRDVIFHNATTLLYRILFLLFAEARGLLPVDQPAYAEVSVRGLAERASAVIRQGPGVPLSGVSLYRDLQRLFGWLNEGAPELHIDAMDGDLFDPSAHPFLEAHRIEDRYLAPALAALAFRPDGSPIPYEDLSVRQLGALYEGLLEYRLFRASSPTVVRPNRSGGANYLTLGPGESPQPADTVLETGDLYFAQSPTERKASGSYYTPQDIVDFIVEQAIAQPLRQHFERFREQNAELLDAAASGNPDAQRRYDEKLTSFAEQEVLTFRVCDPAMGSGHFLIGAGDVLTSLIVEWLAAAPWPNPSISADPAHWRRRVAEHCLFGVDLNERAVQLAKLSLWLWSAASHKPLSFLDYNLRVGNSLISVTPSGLRQWPGAVARAASSPRGLSAGQTDPQLRLALEEPFAAALSSAGANIRSLVGTPTENLDAIQAKRQHLQRAREYLYPFVALADLWIAHWFGHPLSREDYQSATDDIARVWDAKFQPALATAHQHRALHWELAFPDVFLNGDGRTAGFAAVIGNPPYIRQESLVPMKPYLSALFPETFHGGADIYVYFYNQGLRLCRPGGRLAFIVTNKWLRARYGEPLRAYFASSSRIHRIVDFGHAPIFESADVFPCIVVLERPAEHSSPNSTSGPNVVVSSFPRDRLNADNILGPLTEHTHVVPQSRFGRDIWSLEPVPVDHLMSKIRRNGVPLTDYLGTGPFYGVKTGFNEAFVISTSVRDHLIAEDARSGDIILPCLRGQDLGRWSPTWGNLWLIATYIDIEIKHYPAIERYLSRFRERLEPKPRNWPGARWNGRSAGSYKWYEIAVSRRLLQATGKPTIAFADIAWRAEFALVECGAIMLNSAYVLPTSDLYLLGLLNSPVLWAYMWRYAQHAKDEALRLFNQFTQTLPIALASPDMRAEIEATVKSILEISGSRALLSNEDRTHEVARLELVLSDLVYLAYELTPNEYLLNKPG
jgi:hypothetical protein